MIVKLLADLAFFMVSSATAAMNIPSMPDGVFSFLEQAFEYMSVGVGILANFTDIGYLFTLWGVILAVDAGILIYKLILWVLKKIPVAGIE